MKNDPPARGGPPQPDPKYVAPPAARVKILNGGMRLSSYNLRRVRALVVEKSSFTQQVIERVLRTLGVGSLFISSNPEEAFNMVKSNPPDLIFSDWAPQLDGIEFLQTVRVDPGSPNPFVPFVFVTAYTSIDNVKEARDAGMSEFLAKPFTAEKVYERICHVIERQRLFIRTVDYFGPDRRRRTIENFENDRRTKSHNTIIDHQELNVSNDRSETEARPAVYEARM